MIHIYQPTRTHPYAKFEKMIRKAQNEICAAIQELDGQEFREDAWTRPGGGGGISRVLQGGEVFEKAGVNVSVVYGQMPPEAYRAATGEQGAVRRCKLEPSLEATCFQPLNLIEHTVLST